MNPFDIHSILFTIWGYPLSSLELIGTISGFACVYLTAKEKVVCWPVGIVNIVFFFVMFYQIQLYSDMILQIFFLAMTVYGWWKWTHPQNSDESNERRELKITGLTVPTLVLILGVSIVATVGLGALMSRIHFLLPHYFPVPAAYPYPDAFTTVFSITANLLMTVKKRECWILWVIVDVVSVILYVVKGVHLVAIEYVAFGILAAMGHWNWIREQASYTANSGVTTGEAEA